MIKIKKLQQSLSQIAKLPIGGSKIPRHLDQVSKWIEGGEQGPLVVEISLSHGCNHKCLHCGFQQYSKYDYNNLEFIDKESLKLFLHDFKQMGGVEVYFAGNGEPLLHPDFAELAIFSGQLGLSVALSTNGVLLTEDIAKKILPWISWIRVSFNGGNASTYAKVHHCAETDFPTVLENLKILSALKNKLNPSAKIALQFIAYKPNMNSLHELIDNFQYTEADELIIRGVYFKKGHEYTEKDISYLKNFQHIKNVSIRWETFSPSEAAPGWTRCFGINFRTNLDDKGRLIACNKNLFEPCVIGNIIEERLPAIWKSERKKQLFDKLEKGTDISECFTMCQSTQDNIILEKLFEGNING